MCLLVFSKDKEFVILDFQLRIKFTSEVKDELKSYQIIYESHYFYSVTALLPYHRDLSFIFRDYFGNGIIADRQLWICFQGEGRVMRGEGEE